MPEIHNSVQMQESVETSFAFLARTLPEAMQSLAKPQVIACDYEARTLELVFEIQNWMRNPKNILHGGFAAMMLDSTMGILSRCFARGEGITPTVAMEVSYLLPIPVGTRLHIRARAAHAGRAINNILAEGWVEGAPGKLVVTASGAFYAAGAADGAAQHAPAGLR